MEALKFSEKTISVGHLLDGVRYKGRTKLKIRETGGRFFCLGLAKTKEPSPCLPKEPSPCLSSPVSPPSPFYQ